MATRRARLQVKPNIGGPKGAAAKPAATKKPAIQATVPAETAKEVDVVPNDTEKSEGVVNRTLDHPVTKATAIAEKESVKETKKINDDEATIDIGDDIKSPRKDTSSDKIDISKDNKNESLSSPPSRTRMRRFGKVNLAALTGGKKTDDTKTTTSSPQKGDSGDEPSHDKEAKDTPQNSSDNDSKEISASDVKSPASASKSSSVPRRSRFPKAKPNIADAGKRRQRPSEEKGEDSPKGSSTGSRKSTTAVPSIILTPPEDASASESSSSTTSRQAEKSEAVQMTQIQSRPPVPRSPMKTPISPAILASPVKQVHAPDKRQRTVSVSEAPANKRPKKPKVDAPTDKPPDRSTMRMRDLIRWNPKSNPMKPKVKNTTADVVTAVEKENVAKDRPQPAPLPPQPPATAPMDVSEDSNSSMPVPQVTIGPDGNIVINEKSLMVANPDDKGSGEEDAVIDETDVITTYHSFRKMTKSKRWTKRETAKFYKALGMIGIDFTMIQKLFPKRTRQDIKKKFKIEERKNKMLVDKVLREFIRFDPAVFDAPEEEDESSSEEEEEKQKKRAKKEKKAGKKKKETTTETKPRKKPTKRQKKPLNYYEDSHSDEDDEPVNNTLGKDIPWQPPSVSQKDGEVVGILMDMSEGRLSADGNQVENTMVTKSDAATRPEGTNSSVIPGVQNIIAIQTRQMSPSNSGETTGVLNRSVQLNGSVVGPGASALVSRSLHSSVNSSLTTGVNNTQNVLSSDSSGTLGTTAIEPSRHVVTEHVPVEVETSQSEAAGRTEQNQSVYQEVQTETSTYIDDSVLHSMPNTAAEISQGQEDQYVLVTVVPEGSEETVIHIYKLHGGALSQESVAGFAQNLNVSINSGGSTEVENL